MFIKGILSWTPRHIHSVFLPQHAYSLVQEVSCELWLLWHQFQTHYEQGEGQLAVTTRKKNRDSSVRQLHPARNSIHPSHWICLHLIGLLISANLLHPSASILTTTQLAKQGLLQLRGVVWANLQQPPPSKIRAVTWFEEESGCTVRVSVPTSTIKPSW